MNIRFVTRSGTNEFARQLLLLPAARRAERQHLVQQPRSDARSATGKAPKTELRQYQPGTRVGGPIVIPGLCDGRNKAFFFVNYEDTRVAEPGHARRATILHREAQAGHLPLHRRRPASDAVNLLGARRAATARPPRSIRRSRKLLERHPRRDATGGSRHRPLGSDRCSSYVFQSPVDELHAGADGARSTTTCRRSTG